MKSYEIMYIVAPNAAAEDQDKIADRGQQIVRDGGGEVFKLERMGRKKMAYPIGRNAEGNYALLQFRAGGPVVAELERTLRQTESVLRFLTSAVEEFTAATPPREVRRPERSERY